MAGENLKIQNQVAPLTPRYDDKTTTKTRSQKSFELRGREYSNQNREDFVERKNRHYDRLPKTKSFYANALLKN